MQELFSTAPSGNYYYDGSWNKTGIIAFGIAAVFSVGTVWVRALSALSGFGWVIGAALGGLLHVLMMRKFEEVETGTQGVSDFH